MGLAHAWGVPSDVPGPEVIPLMIAMRQDARESEARMIVGIADILGSAFGGGDMSRWMAMMYPPSVRAKAQEDRERADAEVMAMRMELMAGRYNIRTEDI